MEELIQLKSFPVQTTLNILLKDKTTKKIRSREVVRRGFMSDFLFQNISNVFHAPMEVIEMIQNFTAVQEPKNGVEITKDTEEELSLDENGEVSLTDGYVIGRSTEIFGEKIFESVPIQLKETISSIQEPKEDTLEKLKDIFHKEAVSVVMETAQNEYGADICKADKNRLERKLKSDSDRLLNKAYGEYTIIGNKLEKEYEERFIPDEVFREVTSISLDDFRFLRDGGEYTDQETGEKKYFEGKLFDPVVFDDSVKEFLSLKIRLADYFEAANREDIFDYIPPQKTNQIFTPKWVLLLRRSYIRSLSILFWDLKKIWLIWNITLSRQTLLNQQKRGG